jgi:hypothetical protein
MIGKSMFFDKKGGSARLEEPKKKDFGLDEGYPEDNKDPEPGVQLSLPIE